MQVLREVGAETSVPSCLQQATEHIQSLNFWHQLLCATSTWNHFFLFNESMPNFSCGFGKELRLAWKGSTIQSKTASMSWLSQILSKTKAQHIQWNHLNIQHLKSCLTSQDTHLSTCSCTILLFHVWGTGSYPSDGSTEGMRTQSIYPAYYVPIQNQVRKFIKYIMMYTFRMN